MVRERLGPDFRFNRVDVHVDRPSDFCVLTSDLSSTLARLHLHAVLPALADLADLVPEAREIAARWNFSLRLHLPGCPAATLVSPGDGTLRVHPGDGTPARLTLTFLSARQLNRTFLNQSVLPPLPTGGFWRIWSVRPFVALTKLLDRYLQPTPEALTDEAFRRIHLRLLFRVLIEAVPTVAAHDPVAHHSLSHTPEGLVELRVPALSLVGWMRWAHGRLTSAPGPAPAGSPPDAIITFTDLPTADDALLGRLDPNAAVGLGRVDVRGLVPLADGMSVVMDRVEGYIKPPGSPLIPAMAFSGAAA